MNGNNTTNEWQESGANILVFPIGAFEQHGPHMPINTDIVIAEYFADLIAKKFDAAMLPPQGISTSIEHSGFRGSFTLRPETLMQIVRDIADEAEKQNFKILIIVNGHGGNFCLIPVCRDINSQDRKIKILLLSPSEFIDKGLTESSRDSLMDIHAGERETSILMAIKPNAVKESERCKSPVEISPILKQSDLTTFGIGNFNSDGTIGPRQLASGNKGKLIIDSILKNMFPHISERIAMLRSQSRYSGKGGLFLGKMHLDNIPDLAALSQQASWNQRKEDWKFFLDNSDGCYAMFHQNKVVGTVTTISYEKKISWISMVLVEPGYRRMGIAARLMEKAIEFLSVAESVKLDATPMGRNVYEKLGFKDEYIIRRLEYRCNFRSPSVSPEISPILKEDMPQIIEFDRKAFGAERSCLIEYLIKQDTGIKYSSAGIIEGYCMVRDGEKFTHIGPLVANNSDIAKKLIIAATLNNLGNKTVIIDVIDMHNDFVRYLLNSGFSEQRYFTRMYKGRNIEGNPGKYFAVAGPEFG
jgi:creatinine amidohydrolase